MGDRIRDKPHPETLDSMEERVATFLWTMCRAGDFIPGEADWKRNLQRVLADVKAEQDFDDSPGDQSCGEADDWADCRTIAKALVSGSL